MRQKMYFILCFCFCAIQTIGQRLTTPLFGPNAVTESFEGIPYSANNHTLSNYRFGQTNLVLPFTFNSGIVVTSPPWGFDETDLKINDYAKGIVLAGWYQSEIQELHVPDGRAFFLIEQYTHHNATFTFPYSVHKVGFYAEAEGHPLNAPILLEAYDSLDNLIGSYSVRPTGIASNWKNNFIGYYSASGSIAKIKVTGDFLVLDKLTFERECNYPTINTITPSISAPLAVNTSFSVRVDVSGNDNGLAKLNWGDGTPSETINTNSNQHTYTAPGLYSITATAENCGSQVSKLYQHIVVYDPNAGFITGGGWIQSPLNAYIADPALTGKASFSFVSKYLKGSNIPTGNFEFQIGKLNFKSSDLEWLVINSEVKGQIQGKGTINGTGDYLFLLSVIDGDEMSPKQMDKIRVKIWDRKNNKTVYDNQVGALYDAGADKDIAGGSIVIHTAKGGNPVVTAQENKQLVELPKEGKLTVTVMPNPSRNHFSLTASSSSNEPLTIRVFDSFGVMIESKQNIPIVSVIKVGQMYRSGTYYVEVIQGKEKATVQLNKTAQ